MDWALFEMFCAGIVVICGFGMWALGNVFFLVRSVDEQHSPQSLTPLLRSKRRPARIAGCIMMGVGAIWFLVIALGIS